MTSEENEAHDLVGLFAAKSRGGVFALHNFSRSSWSNTPISIGSRGSLSLESQGRFLVPRRLSVSASGLQIVVVYCTLNSTAPSMPAETSSGCRMYANFKASGKQAHLRLEAANRNNSGQFLDFSTPSATLWVLSAKMTYLEPSPGSWSQDQKQTDERT